MKKNKIDDDYFPNNPLNQSLVSVILSTYNDNLDNLSKAIESILSQDYSPLELIVCNDGSCEAVQEFLLERSKHDKRLILLHNDKNIGLSSSLNRCVAAAHGEYLARMDGDDIALPDRINTELAFLKENPNISFCSCSAYVINGDGQITGLISHKTDPDIKDVFSHVTFVHPGVLFRKDALLSVGGYRSDSMLIKGRCEDYDLWNRFYFLDLKGGNVSIPLMDYRETKQNLIKRTSKTRFYFFLTQRSWFKRYRKKSIKVSTAPLFKTFLSIFFPSFVLSFIHNRKLRKNLTLGKSHSK